MEIELREDSCKLEVEKGKRERLLESLEKFTDSFWISLDSNEKIKVIVSPKEGENLNSFKDKFLEEMGKNG